MSASPLRHEALSLYRNLLRAARQWNDYNFREYALRHVRESFRKHRNETDPERVRELLQRGRDDLQVIRRQSALYRMYTTGEPSVMEAVMNKNLH